MIMYSIFFFKFTYLIAKNKSLQGIIHLRSTLYIHVDLKVKLVRKPKETTEALNLGKLPHHSVHVHESE